MWMSKKRRIKGSELQGNAWVFACMGNAQAAYRRVLAKSEVISDQQDSSLATGFFGKRPVVVFLWRPSMDPEFVTSIERLAILGGGKRARGKPETGTAASGQTAVARAAKQEASRWDDDDALSVGEHLDGFAGLSRRNHRSHHREDGTRPDDAVINSTGGVEQEGAVLNS